MHEVDRRLHPVGADRAFIFGEVPDALDGPVGRLGVARGAGAEEGEEGAEAAAAVPAGGGDPGDEASSRPARWRRREGRKTDPRRRSLVPPAPGRKLPAPAKPCRFNAAPFVRKRRQRSDPAIWHDHCFDQSDALACQINGGTGPSFRGMHMAEGESLFGIHGTALTLRSQRLNLLASNIANAATPGYRARDIDFDRALASPRAATAPTGRPMRRSPIACR